MGACWEVVPLGAEQSCVPAAQVVSGGSWGPALKLLPDHIPLPPAERGGGTAAGKAQLHRLQGCAAAGGV